MEKLRTAMEDLIQTKMPDSDWDFFQSKLIYKEFPKKHRLLDAGQTERYLSFTLKGIIRFFIPNPESETTVFFAFDGWFTSVYDSFVTQRPSYYAAEILEPTAMLRISYADLQEVYAKTSVGNLIGRKASETLFVLKTQREISLVNLTAEQRYLQLLKEQPQYIQQIPQKHLASYIGITPQALSRIKNRTATSKD
ncbi:Crp/Fnr family transcriptional regulator [Sphingobacterium lactis]|uniref:cAMP-binding domain of CRP or a regulatory subunit of cAMP-dependent protein kinases n=1 Tax=Sphingobacterium lactis TaxID=797291 RepID=A0A1H6CMW0_9SPHI|nr:Crp/Fnr family transcriptional regulator [Sphingobacterium lactis]SEG74003.1 cAMP-binding domain of CRP or a regulatory subunit of cAMP-dependent protein kinases [Sphingobacterium lactis]